MKRVFAFSLVSVLVHNAHGAVQQHGQNIRKHGFCRAFLIPIMFLANLCVVQNAVSEETLEDKIAKMISLSAAYKGANPTKEDKETFLRECEEYEQKYKEAKDKEQSLANRTLTAVTTAAMGIGGMELARGLAEQNADKEAEADMAAYMATMRCTYGDGKQVRAGPDEIELPGGNNETLMKLRNEYFALAADLKERKEALGMAPGIESEEILDKAATGLYDDENIGIDSGAYASIYRSEMLSSETDQSKIDEDKDASKKRVIAGGVLAGAGAVIGVVGDSLINGKLGKMIKENKNSNNRISKSVTDKLKNCFTIAGASDVNKLDFSKLDLSGMSGVVDKLNCKSMSGLKGKKATDMLDTTTVKGFASSFSRVLGDENAKLFEENKE